MSMLIHLLGSQLLIYYKCISIIYTLFYLQYEIGLCLPNTLYNTLYFNIQIYIIQLFIILYRLTN